MKKSYTRDFIRDEDITIDMIEHRLNEIDYKIHKNNKMNLTDINIICEGIYGGILNKLFGLKLKSMSAEVASNCIAVDLIDYDKKTAVQVTSQNDRNKIKSTIDKFQKSDWCDIVEELDILVIGKKGNYKPPYEFALSNGQTFSLHKNVYDHDWLISQIEKRLDTNSHILVEMYEEINKVYDCGRLDFFDVEKETDEMTGEAELPDYGQKIWKKGVGDVQLTAFIPTSCDEEICCLVEWRKQDISGVFLTLNEEQLKQDYFVDLESFQKKHSVGRADSDQSIYLQIENMRLLLNAHTAYKLYRLFADLHQEYEKEQKRMESIPEAGGPETDPKEKKGIWKRFRTRGMKRR